MMDLQQQLNHLDNVLLKTVTTQFPNLLTDAEKSTTHAYLVLSHAVLEEHLEGLFQRHFLQLLSWLKADLVPIEVTRLAFGMKEWLPKDAHVTYKKRSVPGIMSSEIVRRAFNQEVKNNHGLAPQNIENLAKLVGLDWARFDKRLDQEIGNLKTLASKRGEAGHLSPFTDKAIKLSRQDYPENVREWVSNGREAVERIDNYLTELIQSQQPPSLITDWDGN